MNLSALRSYVHCFPKQSTHLAQSPKSTHLFLPINPCCYRNSTLSSHSPLSIITSHPKQGATCYSTKPHVTESTFEPKTPQQQVHLQVSSNGFPRWVVFSAASVGIALFLVGIEVPKALAFGPEGPLVEEFWDNMRRYGLYILTVSTGVIYTIFEPILELLKNPISAILIIIILGGSIYLVSQVLSAMFGISEFAYEYGY